MSGPAPSSGEGAGRRAEAAGRGARRRWGAVLGLGAAVLFLGVADGFPLIALPLGVLLIGWTGRRRWWWVGLAVVIWALALVPGAGTVQTLSRGWALLVGGAFLAVTLARPRWPAFSRALAAVATAMVATGGLLLTTGAWPVLDAAMASHFRGMASLTSWEIVGRFPDAGWATNLGAMADRMADAQGSLFPALLALQSLAALALVWWAFAGGRRRGARPALRPLREFRFPDALVWVLVAGLVLLLLPAGDAGTRAAHNVLLFMGVLYALRGVAVFVFLARGAPTTISVMLGLVATVLFYPIVLTAALLVGLGDTWLDVRGRVVAAAARA